MFKIKKWNVENVKFEIYQGCRVYDIHNQIQVWKC